MLTNSFVVTLLIFMGSTGYGLTLLRKNTTGIFIFRLGLGLWLVAHLVYLAGLLGQLHSFLIWSAVILGVFLLFFKRRDLLDQDRHFYVNDEQQPSNWVRKISWIFFGSFIGLAFIGALSPPAHRDSLVYHLALPKLYLLSGQWYEIPHNIYSYFPGLTESFYTLALGLGSQYPNLIHFCFGLACLAATYELGQILKLKRRTLLLCLIALSATPTFWSEMTWAYVDLANTFFWILTVTAFLHWRRERRTMWLVLLGFFMGAAYCCKYTSLFLFMLAPLGILLELRQDKNVSPAAVAKFLAIPIMTGVFAASPWWLRNVLLTGNPFFPFFWDLFPSTSIAWDGERTEKYSLLLETYGGTHKGFVDYLLAPFRVFTVAEINDPDLYDGKLGWYYLLSLPVFLFWKKLPANIRYLAGIIAIYFIYWTFSSQQARFLLVILPFMSLFVGYLLQAIEEHFAGQQNLEQKSGWGQFVKPLALVAVLLAIGFNIKDTLAVFRQQRYLDYFLKNVNQKEYLKSKLYYYEMYQFINSSLPEDANIFLVTTGNQGYYLERRYYSDAVFEHHTMLEILSEAASAQEMVEVCRQRGWSHLLIRLDYFIKNLGPDFQGLRMKKFNEFLESLKLINSSESFYLFEIPAAKIQQLN